MSEIGTILAGMRRELEGMSRSLAQLKKTHVAALSEEWITKSQTMALLRISSRKLEYLKSSGRLPYSKVQGMIYIKVADVEQLLQQNYVHPLLTPKNHSNE